MIFPSIRPVPLEPNSFVSAEKATRALGNMIDSQRDSISDTNYRANTCNGDKGSIGMLAIPL